MNLSEYIELHEERSRVAGRRVWQWFAVAWSLLVVRWVTGFELLQLLVLASWLPMFYFMLTEARNDGAASALRGLLR